jgi:hypothetical protein
MSDEFIPEPWATHIAISKVNGRKESCAWHPPADDYLDEDPTTLQHGDWSGGYKHHYWEFEPIKRLDKDAEQ